MKKLLVNVETQETEIIDLSDEELIALEKSQTEHNADLEERELKKIAKDALLTKLGITEEEAKLLLS